MKIFTVWFSFLFTHYRIMVLFLLRYMNLSYSHPCSQTFFNWAHTHTLLEQTCVFPFSLWFEKWFLQSHFSELIITVSSKSLELGIPAYSDCCICLTSARRADTWLCETKDGELTETQNDRVRRELWRSPCPTPLLEQHHLEHTGPCPDSFWVSPRMERSQPPWATC